MPLLYALAKTKGVFFFSGIPKKPSQLWIPMYSCTISLREFLKKQSFGTSGHGAVSPNIIQPYVQEASCVVFQAELLSICTGRGVFRVEHLGNNKFNGEVPSTIQHCQHAPLKKNGSIFWPQKRHPKPHLKKPQVHDITFSTFCHLGV